MVIGLFLSIYDRRSGDFAPAGATRAVCPGPDRLREGGRSFSYGVTVCPFMVIARRLGFSILFTEKG